MCGLVGVISKNKSGLMDSHCNMFTQLLYADQLRGSDGTGIFFNNKLGEPYISTLKYHAPSSKFIDSKEYDNAINVAFKKANFLVGHNRSATKGKINFECTHPFRENNITLVHNGTLLSHKELNADYEVDSRAICYSMAKKGYKETLRTIDGAFALIWFNSKEGTLNICRNIQRPLYMIETSDCYIIVSELELGEWIAKRNNKHVIKSLFVPTETLYKFDIKDMSNYVTEKLEYKKYKPPVYQYESSYQGTGSKFTSSNESTKGTKAHTIGEIVKFKACEIINTHTHYLEGDILTESKNLAKALRTNESYEGERRIRIYGKTDDLTKLKEKKHLIGKIIQTFWAFGRSNYIVEDVKEEEDTNNIVVIQSKVEHKCEVCGCYAPKTKYYEGMKLCEDCHYFYDTGKDINYGYC